MKALSFLLFFIFSSSLLSFAETSTVTFTGKITKVGDSGIEILEPESAKPTFLSIGKDVTYHGEADSFDDLRVDDEVSAEAVEKPSGKGWEAVSVTEKDWKS